MQRKSAFSRRLPDLVTEELVSVLSQKGASFEFKQLFDVVHDRLKKRNAASGGEEMLRLRAYEKLQHLVSRNMVKKNGKKYKGLASLANAIAPEEPLPPAVPPTPVKPKAPVKKPAPIAPKKTAKPTPKLAAKPTVKKVITAKAKAPVKKATLVKSPVKKPVAKKAVVKTVKTVKKVSK
jgi:outer membrane biosynthesis protein TonB